MCEGFLNVNSGAASGIPSNLGILDQIAALHWIQENIQVSFTIFNLHGNDHVHQDFGGDRNSVTVLGHGTGSACLHYLMTSDALPHGEFFEMS